MYYNVLHNVVYYTALATSQPNARVPHKCTMSNDWIGLPREMNFRHPSAMTVNELRYIQENIADIHYIVVCYNIV